MNKRHTAMKDNYGIVYGPSKDVPFEQMSKSSYLYHPNYKTYWCQTCNQEVYSKAEMIQAGGIAHTDGTVICPKGHPVTIVDQKVELVFCARCKENVLDPQIVSNICGTCADDLRTAAQEEE